MACLYYRITPFKPNMLTCTHTHTDQMCNTEKSHHVEIILGTRRRSQIHSRTLVLWSAWKRFLWWLAETCVVKPNAFARHSPPGRCFYLLEVSSAFGICSDSCIAFWLCEENLHLHDMTAAGSGTNTISAARVFSILPLSRSLPGAVTSVGHSSILQLDLRNNEENANTKVTVASQVKVVESSTTKYSSRSILVVAGSRKVRGTHQAVLQWSNLQKIDRESRRKGLLFLRSIIVEMFGGNVALITEVLCGRILKI